MSTVKEQYAALQHTAASFGQEHIFRFWDSLSSQQRSNFLQQIQNIDFSALQGLFDQYIGGGRAAVDGKLEPVKPIPIARDAAGRKERARMRRAGEEMLRQGKVGALLVAGGQGSRLGFDGPKGKFPITPVKNKTLFQLHAEKLLALNTRYDTRIPWYIMTSQSNDAETRAYFEQHAYFGLPAEDVFFFQQGMMPALDASGKLILDEPGHIFTNPDGHGGIFAALARTGAVDDMQQRGLGQLFYFQVDNVLVSLCDPVFIGYHLDRKAQMSAKVCPKRDAFEKVGVVGRINGKLGVIEYSDLSDELKQARAEDGSLLYNAGSIAIHVLDVAFVASLAGRKLELPWHVAHKKIPYIDAEGKRIEPDAPNGYKFEKFIFDALAWTENSAILEVERSEEFSPVKNADGEDSPATARRDMSQMYARWFRACGYEVPERENLQIEVSPAFALDADEFAAKISGEFDFSRPVYL